jgi:hypothetical protein
MIEILANKKVRVLISGGIQKRFQEMFHDHEINVIWGVAGQLNNVLRAFRKGRLQCGIGNVDGYRKTPASSVSDSPKETP